MKTFIATALLATPMIYMGVGHSIGYPVWYALVVGPPYGLAWWAVYHKQLRDAALAERSEATR